MKKFVTSLIMTVLFMCLVGISNVSAETSGIYTYELYGNTATIIGCDTSVSGEVVIPSTLDGYQIVGIGNFSFANCYDITSITIPNGVRYIDDSAFRSCESLANIELPNSINYIGDYAFIYCKSLINVEIPSSVRDIGMGIFQGCSGLTNVIIQNGLTYIEYETFSYCNNLTNIEIPNSVEYIGGYAFNSCYNLIDIEIPNSVECIDEYAFNGCEILASIEIPDSVTSIYDGAFNNCDALTSVFLSENVTTIKGNPFSGCNSLESIEVDVNNPNYCSENNVIFNKDKTNLICASGKRGNYIVPDGVIVISDSAFSRCSSLTSIIIPSSVTTIGENAFFRCYSLKNIEIDENNLNYSSKGNAILSKDGTTLLVCTGLDNEYNVLYGVNYVIPNGVTTIAENAFYGCNNLTSITVPVSVTCIENNAFKGCNIRDIYYESDQTNYEKIIVGEENINLEYANIVYSCVIVRFIGDYEEERLVTGNQTDLPIAPDGYEYKFTVNDEKWTGKQINSSVTVVVKSRKLSDLAEINVINVDNKSVISNQLFFSYCGDKLPNNYIVVSENALCKIYSDSGHLTEVSELTLVNNITKFYVVVTAENGVTKNYVLNITKTAVPDVLGEIEIVCRYGSGATFKFVEGCVGYPVMQCYYGDKENYITNEISASYDKENNLITVNGLPDKEDIYICFTGTYGDTILFGDVIKIDEMTLQALANITILEGYYESGKVYCKINVQTNEIDGILIVAAFDSNDKMIAIATDVVADSLFSFNCHDEPSYFKVFFWKDISSVIPLARMVNKDL